MLKLPFRIIIHEILIYYRYTHDNNVSSNPYKNWYGYFKRDKFRKVFLIFENSLITNLCNKTPINLKNIQLDMASIEFYWPYNNISRILNSKTTLEIISREDDNLLYYYHRIAYMTKLNAIIIDIDKYNIRLINWAHFKSNKLILRGYVDNMFESIKRLKKLLNYYTGEIIIEYKNSKRKLFI